MADARRRAEQIQSCGCSGASAALTIYIVYEARRDARSMA